MGEHDPKDPQGGNGEAEKVTVSAEDWKKVTEQVDNLTKGIASYRDEAKNAKELATAAQEALEAWQKEHKEAGEKTDDVELSPEDEKKFAAWAKTQGFASKEDLEQERNRIASESAKSVANTAVSEFLEKHPEYDDDEAWAKVQEEFGLYKAPADLAGYRALLERIHKDLNGGTDTRNRARAEVKAEISKNSRLALGGRGGSGSDDHDAAIDKLQEKYPNLSRDQIEARLADLQRLYPKDEK